MRGIKEELGLDVEKLESTGTFRFKKRGQLMHGFIASVKKQEPVCSREIESALWVPAAKAPEIMFEGWNGNRAWEIYSTYMKEKRHSDNNCMKSGGWNDVEKISC